MNETPKKVALNSAHIVVGKITATLISMVVAFQVIRYLGPDNYGIYSYVLTVLTFTQVLSGVNIEQIFVKKLSLKNVDENELCGNAICIKLFLSMIAILIICIYAFFSDNSVGIALYIAVAALSLLFSFNNLFAGIYQVRLNSFIGVIVEIVTSLLSATLLLWMVWNRKPLVYFIMLQAFSIAPQAIVNYIIAERHIGIKPKFKFKIDIWKVLLRESAPIFFGSIFVTINMRIDQVIIYSMLDTASLGQYAAIVKLVEGINFVPAAFMASLFPLMCRTYNESYDKFLALYARACKYLVIMVMPIVVIVSLFPEQILFILYGQKYLPAADAMRVLIWSELFIFLSCAHSGAIMAAGLQKELVVFYPIGTLVNVVMNLVLIPRIGIVGASIATLNSFGGILLFTQYIKPKLRPYMNIYLLSIWKPLIISIIIISVVMLIKLTLLSGSIFTVSAYVILVLLLKVIDNDDLIILKSIFNRH